MTAGPALRLGTLVLALVLGLLGAGWWLRARAGEDGPALVGMSSELRELFLARADPDRPREPAWGEPGFPPPLVREPLDERTVALLYPILRGGRHCVYDPELLYRREPLARFWHELTEHPGGGFEVRTNSLGLRDDDEPSASPPDLRVLVTGASNVQGVCANRDTAVQRLEALLAARLPELSVEVLGAGVGGYNFYNFLAVLEHHRTLRPDVFVVVAHGGNDFFGGVRLHRWFCREGPGNSPELRRFAPLGVAKGKFPPNLVAIEVAQAVYMLDNPADVETAVTAACSATAEMQRLCAEQGIRFLCAYLPPPLQGQPEVLAAERAIVLERLGLCAEDLAVSDRIADRWLEYLASRGIACLDLRPAFRAARERLFWTSDAHVDLEGQRVMAEALLLLVLEGL